MASTVYPLTLPADLDRQIRETADQAGLSMADAMRMALKIGLPKVAEAAPSGRLINLKPWPKGTLTKAYRDRRVDGDYALESVRDAQSYSEIE